MSVWSEYPERGMTPYTAHAALLRISACLQQYE